MKGNDHGKGAIYALPYRRFLLRAGKGLLLACLLCCAQKAKSQTITLTLKKASLASAFQRIESQSSYQFVYTHESLESAKPVSLSIKNVPLHQALTLLFKEQPLSFSIEDHYILVKVKIEVQQRPFLPEVRGTVTGAQNEPLAGATVRVNGTTQMTATGSSGNFLLRNVDSQATLTITSVGYQAQKVAVMGKTELKVRLSIAVSALDETVVIAYGTTTKRLSTGSVTNVSAGEISRQPVFNPLAALEGRVPGMVVTQSTGLPGASVKIQVRGRTALDQGLTDDQPLFIIDGVPFAPNNSYLNTLKSALGLPDNSLGTVSPGGLSPFNTINPSDIESIEVLKDADATAIYGSRGASGVILITTKKGSAGKTRFDLNFQQGYSRAAHEVTLMSTPQYLKMRREAFLNDGVTPTESNAYDLLKWDTTRETNFKKLLVGGTARSTEVQGSLSGGSELTRFHISTGYRSQSTVFPGDKDNRQGTLHFNVSHSTRDKKFSAQLSGSYAADKNNLTVADPTSYINLPPNFRIYDSSGHLAWNEGGIVTSYQNPLAILNQSYSAATDNLMGNLQLGFRPVKGLNVRLNAGFNSVALQEIQANPLSSQNPLSSPVRSATFANNRFKSWILEPQAEYVLTLGKGRMDLLFGSTWQNQQNEISTASASGYISDALLNSLNGASSQTSSREAIQYRYQALFGRIGYNLASKYLLNFSARRDGSSRFGPGKQFAGFGAVGAAWIFSKERLFTKNLPFISFGKLRASYGVTGNDKILNYQYLDTWEPTTNTYQGGVGLAPSRLFNPDYHWEKTTKLESALDLGFFRDRLLFSVAWYRNQSSNQLVQYKLPSTAGFASVVKNLPAEVENTGVEFSISSINIRTGTFSWSTSANLTIPKNRLVSFPGLSLSSYATRYVEGQSLNLIYAYRYLGVDPASGLFLVEDINKDNAFNTKDYQVLGSLDPLYYGGLENSFEFKGFRFDVFFQCTKQTGVAYLANSGFPPGSIHNMPVEVLTRWQKPGDEALIQRFTQLTSTSQPAYNAFSNLFLKSDGAYTDASYIRLKNISLSYTVNGKWLKRCGLSGLRLYASGQNLCTFTSYKGGDPETQNYLRLPPLKTIAGGIKITF